MRPSSLESFESVGRTKLLSFARFGDFAREFAPVTALGENMMIL